MLTFEMIIVFLGLIGMVTALVLDLNSATL